MTPVFLTREEKYPRLESPPKERKRGSQDTA